jgi:16S rRNA C967 or C1407 C5-methylase (RsmB/RsmF family)
LPSSFRIGKDVPDALRDVMEKDLNDMLEKCKPVYGEVVNKLKFLPHAYQINLDRGTIRKNADLEPLKNWLKLMTESGFISRQETVSMIPPVVLAPKGGDLVLDMCAAPGSKTGQLLEELSNEDDGCLVANDSSSSRAFMLVHQLKRIMDVNPSVLITCCDAQFFPSVTQFDRVLADVPCSGDGTSRKNIGIWKSWAQTGALGLHKLQYDIAWKGAANLTKVGGYLCYSTCSHNPLENEAVVAELLRKAEGSLELVEYPLEGFRTRPGWSNWKVFFEEKSQQELKARHAKTNNVFVNRGSGAGAKVDAGADKTEDKAKDETMDEAKDGEAKESTETVGEETKEGSETATDDKNGDSKEDEDIANTFKKFEPATWDEANLMELAKSSGLLSFNSIDEVPTNMRAKFRPSCFPPTKEEAERFHLERCIRCLAQDNDTGGFFVALLKKVAPIGARETKRLAREEKEEEEGPDAKRAKLEEGTEVDQAMADVPADGDKESTVDADDEPEVEGGRGKLNLIKGKDGERKRGKDDFIPVDDDVMGPIIEHYGLSAEFPKGQYMSRACGDAKVIYYIAKGVKDLIDMGLQDRVTVINSGLKGLVRNNKDCDCRYRIAQEGVHFLMPYMTKRIFVLSREDFGKCLTPDATAITTFSENFQEGVRAVSVGSFVVVLDGYQNDCSRKMMMTMWRCRGDNINGLVAKIELDSMITKLAALEAKAAAK